MEFKTIIWFMVVVILLLQNAYCTQNPNMITTQMEVNNIKYDAICDCGKEVTQQIKSISEVKCTPSKLKIRQDKEGANNDGGSDIQLNDISDMLGKPRDTTFVDPHLTSFRCLDGRYNGAGLYTMGGDAGEFFLGLVIYEELLKSKLTPSQVKRLLQGYIDQMEHDRFHWCTDDQAVQHIAETIGDYQVNMKDPGDDIKEQILEILTSPYNIGDSFFKVLLNQFEKLLIRKELVETFITVFYRLLWDKSTEYAGKMDLIQLVGSSKEIAFIDVRNDKNWNAPLLSVKDKNTGHSVFFNHHEAAKARRSQIAYYFSTQLKHAGFDFSVQVLEHRFDNHALSFLEVTGKSIAQYLPFYTILYE